MVNKDDIRRYDPAGVKYDGDPQGGFSVMVVDQAGSLPDFWVDCWIEGGDPMMDWNQYIFFTKDADDRLRQALQRNIKVSEKAMDAALNYLRELGFITQIDSGRWRYANPDVFAQRRDVIASMGRKAKANRNRGWAKLTGRTDF